MLALLLIPTLPGLVLIIDPDSDEVAVLNGPATADIPSVRISVFDAEDLARDLG